MRQYWSVLTNRNYLLLWLGFTVSQLGDGLTWIALVWLVYKLTGSTAATGLLLVFYTAPTILGGLVAGVLLDRYGRKRMMVIDNIARCVIMAVVPILYHLQLLQIWHLYTVAAIFGGLMMISLAGGPALIPALVPADKLNTANALESISWSMSDIFGRALGGILVGLIGAPYVLAIDAVTYLFLVVCLLGIRLPNQDRAEAGARPATGSAGVSVLKAFQFIFTNKLILMITVIFMVVNMGAGAFGVVLPVYSDTVLTKGAQGFGFLTASNSFGQLISSVAVGAVRWNFPLGRSIAVALVLAGSAFLGLLAPHNLVTAGVVMFLFGFFFAPVNVWAQTVRMQVIPEELRGRVFSILRTIIRSTLPLAAALVGTILPLVGIRNSILLVGGLVVIAGAIGLTSRTLREPQTTARAANHT